MTGKDRHGLASPVVIRVNHGNGKLGDRGTNRRPLPVKAPVPSLTTARNLALANLAAKALNAAEDDTLPDALEEQDIDPRRLVFIDGEPYILDIRFRLLENRELARAMEFDDEEQGYEFHGNNGEITRQIGNAVPARLAARWSGRHWRHSHNPRQLGWGLWEEHAHHHQPHLHHRPLKPPGDEPCQSFSTSPPAACATAPTPTATAVWSAPESPAGGRKPVCAPAALSTTPATEGTMTCDNEGLDIKLELGAVITAEIIADVIRAAAFGAGPQTLGDDYGPDAAAAADIAAKIVKSTLDGPPVTSGGWGDMGELIKLAAATGVETGNVLARRKALADEGNLRRGEHHNV